MPPTLGALRPAIRPSVDADIPAIADIYRHHVLHGTGSFEELPPGEVELARRRHDVRDKGLPYLVAEIDGRIAGYAYANLYRPRSAYRFSLEDSIYIAPDAVGRGIGSALLAHLLAEGERLGYRQMVAVIGDSQNHGSVGVHAKAGFRTVGTIDAIGFKFGRWLDSVIMQKPLGPGSTVAPIERTGSR